MGRLSATALEPIPTAAHRSGATRTRLLPKTHTRKARGPGTCAPGPRGKPVLAGRLHARIRADQHDATVQLATFGGRVVGDRLGLSRGRSSSGEPDRRRARSGSRTPPWRDDPTASGCTPSVPTLSVWPSISAVANGTSFMKVTTRSSSVIDSGRSSALSKSNSTFSVCSSGQPDLVDLRAGRRVRALVRFVAHAIAVAIGALGAGGGGGGGGAAARSTSGTGRGAPRAEGEADLRDQVVQRVAALQVPPGADFRSQLHGARAVGAAHQVPHQAEAQRRGDVARRPRCLRSSSSACRCRRAGTARSGCRARRRASGRTSRRRSCRRTSPARSTRAAGRHCRSRSV